MEFNSSCASPVKPVTQNIPSKSSGVLFKSTKVSKFSNCFQKIKF